MRLIANEKSIPRIHLVGTLLIVLLLTVGLAGYNLWQSRQDAQSSFDRIEQALTEQIDARLKDEMLQAITTIKYTRSQTEAVLRESIMLQVDSAYQIAKAIHTREFALRPATEVQKMIVEALRPVRFYDGRGYFFIDDMNGQFILLPTSPQFEGKTLLDNQDDTGHFIMRGLIAAARLPRGEGFSRYRWYTPDNPKVMAEKLSYVRYFEPYDWLIGTGDYLYKWEEKQKQEAILQLRTYRFGTTGHVALFDTGGRPLLSPSNATHKGKTEADLPVFERSVLEKLLSTARAGGGIVHYDWPQADTGTLAKKTAYVQTYAPWQWVVVTTLFDDEMHAAVAAEQQTHTQLSTRQALTIALAGLAALLLGLTVSWIFSRWTRQLFKEYHRNNLAQQDALYQQADALHKTQVSLQESEHHFRTLANSGTALIWTSGVDKLCNYFNEPWLRYTGRTLEQELGNGWTEGVHPDDYDRCLNFYVSHFDRREPFSMEYRLRKANGEYGWILDLGNPRHDSEGNFTGYIGHCYDITERKRAEEELLKSEERHRTILNTAMDGFFVTDSAGRFVEINETYCVMSGYSEQELLRLSVSSVEDVETAADTAAHLQKVMALGQDRFESRHRRKDGSVFDVDVSVKLQPADKSQLVVFVRDITERKRAENALLESEERFRAANEASLDCLLLLRSDRDEAGQINDFIFVDLNRRAEEMLHMNRDQLIGRRLCEELPINREAGFFEKYKRVVETGLPLEEEFLLPETHVPAAWYYHQVVKVHDGIFICHRDIGDRKRAEDEEEKLQAQLTQAQKMESVGRLAGGVAHDFNNMLGVILGHTEMAMDEMDPSQPLYNDLQQIGKAAERSADLTRQLLAFARKQTIDPRVLDLNDTVEGMLKMLRRLIGEDIDLAWMPGKNLWPVKMDPSQIDQILANLCVNARDAIKGVGKITIETRDITFDEAYCAAHTDFIPGGYVLLAVSDDGCGMDRGTLTHLFEPFFTTKGVGEGTGLGLATVYGIVRQNNGFIDVYSERGQGTRFAIYLPRHAGTAGLNQATDSAKPAERGHETILLVEDEPAILHITVLLLERLGYKVLSTDGPGKAIRLAEEHPGRIDLLMTDVVMPEMNGRELAEKILTFSPNLRCLFMSGYTADVIARHGVLEEGVHFIQKPFSRKKLAAKVRETLDGE